MNTIQIEILNPKAGKLLQDLADLELIAIKKPVEKGFSNILLKLRADAVSAPTLEEITDEVEAVRTKNHGKNQ
jgi:hypothetical protein